MSKVLVLGGSRSGKSAHAENLLADRPDVTYLATSPPPGDDAEWAARVAAHRARRPASWTTVESTDPGDLLLQEGAVLVDSVTTWVAALMDGTGVWTDEPGAAGRLSASCNALLEAWTATPAHVVAVSDEVGLGVVPDTRSGRLFRDVLGSVNQQLAGSADEVWFLVAGLPQRLR